MSTYPGENPQPDDQAPSDQPPNDRPSHDGPSEDPASDERSAGTEPTQPVGYWERQAAEHAQQPGPQDQPSPTTAYPQGDPDPYRQQPYSGRPYSGQQGGYPAPGQSGPHYQPHPPAPGQPPYGVVADHPQSTLALVLGLVSLVGAFALCGVTLVVSPFAWVIGRKAVREIEASQGQVGGLSQARAGMIMGIIGTVLLILAIVAIVAFVVILIAAETTNYSSV
jgi:hypothetical protein